MEKGATYSDVSQGYAFTHQVGTGQKVGVQSSKSFLNVFLSTLSVTFVELHNTKAWEYPGAWCWQDFIICKIKMQISKYGQFKHFWHCEGLECSALHKLYALHKLLYYIPAKFIQETTWAWSMGVFPRSCSLATAQAMALLSKMHLPSVDSKAGTCKVIRNFSGISQ